MTDDRPRSEDGTFETQVTESDVLETLDGCDDPVMTAKEIADEIDASRSTVGERLDAMLDGGLVGRKRAGAHAVVWWPEGEAEAEPEEQGVDTGAGGADAEEEDDPPGDGEGDGEEDAGEGDVATLSSFSEDDG